MGILSFEKPKKVKSTEDHNKKYSSDSGIAGTYVSNMSQEDKERWKGKHIKGNDERVEIRKVFDGVHLLIIVYKEPRITISEDWRDCQRDHKNIKMSMNGKLDISSVDFQHINQAIREANDVLNPRVIKVNDPVHLPFNEIGIVREINEDLLWGFPYKVEIIKSNGFNEVGEMMEYKSEQLNII